MKKNPPSLTLRLGFDNKSIEKIEEVKDCDFINPIGEFKISGIRIWGKTDKYVNGLEIFYDGQSIGPKVGWKGNVALEKKDFLYNDQELIQIFVTYGKKKSFQYIEKIVFRTLRIQNNEIMSYNFGNDVDLQKCDKMAIDGYYIRKISFGLGAHLSYIEAVFIEKSICEYLKKNPKQNLINFEMKSNTEDSENYKKQKQ